MKASNAAILLLLTPACEYMVSLGPVVPPAESEPAPELVGTWTSVRNPDVYSFTVSNRDMDNGLSIKQSSSDNLSELTAFLRRTPYGFIADVVPERADGYFWQEAEGVHALVPVVVKRDCIWLVLPGDEFSPTTRSKSEEWDAITRNRARFDKERDRCVLQRVIDAPPAAVQRFFESQVVLEQSTPYWAPFNRMGTNARCSEAPSGDEQRPEYYTPEEQKNRDEVESLLFGSPGVRFHFGAAIGLSQQLRARGLADAMLEANIGVALGGHRWWVAVEGFGGGLPRTSYWTMGGGIGFLHTGVGGFTGYVARRTGQSVSHGVRVQLRFELAFVGLFLGSDLVVGAEPTFQLGATIRYPVYGLAWDKSDRREAHRATIAAPRPTDCVDVDDLGVVVCVDRIRCQSNTCEISARVTNDLSHPYVVDDRCEWMRLRSGPHHVRGNPEDYAVTDFSFAEDVPDGILRPGEGGTWTGIVPVEAARSGTLLLGDASNGPLLVASVEPQ